MFRRGAVSKVLSTGSDLADKRGPPVRTHGGPLKVSLNARVTPGLVALLLTVACGTDPAADVTIEHSMRVQGGGTWSDMSSSGTGTLKIAGERARLESRLDSRSVFPGMAGGSDSTEIVRLDTGVLVTLKAGERSYRVRALDEIRRGMSEALEQTGDMHGSGALPISEDQCQWSPPNVDVTFTGARGRFGGVETEQTTVLASQVCTVPASGQVCEVRWNLDYWMAPRMPGHEDARAFHDGLARALGGGDELVMARLRYGGMMAVFRHGWDEATSRISNLQGYPARSVMSLEIGGEECRSGDGTPIAMDQAWAPVADAGWGLGAAARELAADLFGRFMHGATSEPEPAPRTASSAGAGHVTVFSIATEVTHVDTLAIPATEFEAPAGWQRLN